MIENHPEVALTEPIKTLRQNLTAPSDIARLDALEHRLAKRLYQRAESLAPTDPERVGIREAAEDIESDMFWRTLLQSEQAGK